ncbi:helix-turn-helix transcriptional regulator [Hymenobacter sp. GOD-10R]|uniref:helix-turn-helix domain-containing protein n=1 Tax=Hymenobacter sp. GOD-10R TaxID=3093922 RepID=UPI002D77523F|nr:helix-turn-helix transcriptional regulator [Hymenobacter sp. GOD-10R]WRQ28891.1 helix-turn-helix transcriptional regulator [Hymenobacter sp. GOD-10R]
MSEPIPTYRLQAFASDNEVASEVFFPDYAGPKPRLPLHLPYRGDYYKISLCLRGTAELKANLETYTVSPDCLILATPDVLKQWLHITDDYETLSVFFTKEFITTNNAATGNLRFFVAPPTYVLQLSAAQAANIAASFRFLQQKYKAPSAQRDNILKNILNSLLYEIGELYDQQAVVLPVSQPRSQLLAKSFRQLVQAHCVSARSVKFYAAALCISPKYLTELVKAVTGRTASDWIAEAVVLEAKVLLQNHTLAVYQVAASLHFADQFAFSRFFKKSTGLSPTAYRQVS